MVNLNVTFYIQLIVCIVFVYGKHYYNFNIYSEIVYCTSHGFTKFYLFK